MDDAVLVPGQLAIDTELLSKRAYNGAGGSPTIFGPSSRWSGETEGLAFDPKAARDLVHEA